MRSFSIVVVLFYTVVAAQSAAASELSFHLNDNANVVVVNRAMQNPVEMYGVEFRSYQGHLVYGSASPFGAALGPNSRYIPLVDPNGAVQLDGQVTFDIKYDGEDPGDELSVVVAPTANQNLPSLMPAVYLPADKAFPSVSMGMTGDHHWTVRASNESLSNLRISSPSGSLVPGSSAAPFYNLLESTPHEIQYGTAANAVRLDGTIKLDSRWAPGGLRDVSYSATTSRGTFDPIRVPLSVYDGPPKAPVMVTIDENANNTVSLFGFGQEVEEFQIISPSGSLLVADNPAPFDAMSENGAKKVVFDGASIIDGAMNTNIRYNSDVGGRDLSYSYKLVGNDQQFGGPLGDFELPPGIEVSIDQFSAELPLVLSGNGQELRDFSVFSSRGSLRPGSSPAPFSSFSQKSSRRVELVGSSNVTIDGKVTTDIFYNAEVDAQDLRYAYQMDGEIFPRAGVIATADYPNVQDLSVQIGSDGRSSIILSGSGQSLESFELRSQSGSLLVGDDPSPLGAFGERNPNRVSLVGSSPVSIDGSVKTDIRYNKFVNGRDLEYSYDLLGVEAREGKVSSYPTMSVEEQVGVHILELDDGTFPIALLGAGQPGWCEFHIGRGISFGGRHAGSV